LIDDIRVVVRSSDTEEVQIGTSAHDIRAAKQHAEVIPAIFYVNHSIFVSAIAFMCQPFHFCVNHFLSQPFLC
jgi:hypothetical protein